MIQIILVALLRNATIFMAWRVGRPSGLVAFEVLAGKHEFQQEAFDSMVSGFDGHAAFSFATYRDQSITAVLSDGGSDGVFVRDGGLRNTNKLCVYALYA